MNNFTLIYENIESLIAVKVFKWTDIWLSALLFQVKKEKTKGNLKTDWLSHGLETKNIKQHQLYQGGLDMTENF